MRTVRALKSTPTVGVYTGSKLSAANAASSELFPARLSPTKTTCACRDAAER